MAIPDMLIPDVVEVALVIAVPVVFDAMAVVGEVVLMSMVVLGGVIPRGGFRLAYGKILETSYELCESEPLKVVAFMC